MRLARDLEVNPPGVALAIDLMVEIDALRARLHRLGR
jgi:chaperone modulatory protein CbpM